MDNACIRTHLNMYTVAVARIGLGELSNVNNRRAAKSFQDKQTVSVTTINIDFSRTIIKNKLFQGRT